MKTLIVTLALLVLPAAAGCDIPRPPNGSITCSPMFQCPEDADNPGTFMKCCWDNRCYRGDCPPMAPGASPVCPDKQKDAREVDIDCGAASCQTCAVGKMCESDADCASNFCYNSRCTATQDPCNNGVIDGLETAADCGGGECPRCGNGKGCISGNDCVSTHCIGMVCTSMNLFSPLDDVDFKGQESRVPWHLRPLKKMTDDDWRQAVEAAEKSQRST